MTIGARGIAVVKSESLGRWRHKSDLEAVISDSASSLLQQRAC